MTELEPRALTRERALRWCSNLPGWFPDLRPAAPEVLAFAERVATKLGPNDGEIPAAAIEQGVALAGDEGRAELVEWFAAEHDDQWTAVCSDSGDPAALEHALSAAAVRAAIFERRLPAPERLADLESGRAPAHSSREVLAITLFPETVWSVVDVQEAERVAAAATDAWLRAAMAVAAERRTEAEVRRVRTLAAILRRRLPARDFPYASELLERAYARVVDDRRFAEEVVDTLLPIYVTSRAGAYITSKN